jgi:hypothetical protein
LKREEVNQVEQILTENLLDEVLDRKFGVAPVE